jgi:hypothetical protein
MMGITTTFAGNVTNNGEIFTASNSSTIFSGQVTGDDGEVANFTGAGAFRLEGNLVAESVSISEGTMLLLGSASSVDRIDGEGTLWVCDDAALTAGSLHVDTLTIGGSADMHASSLSTVPEPSSLILFGICAIFIGTQVNNVGSFMRFMPRIRPSDGRPRDIHILPLNNLLICGRRRKPAA